MKEMHIFPVKKVPVILTILFDFLTGGIYSCIWFISRRRDLNTISSSKALGQGIPILCMILLALNLAMQFLGGVFDGLAETYRKPELLLWAAELDSFSTVLRYGGGILLLIPTFRVRSILERFLKYEDQFAVSPSGAATFFFRIYYLQYRINKIHKQAAEKGQKASPMPHVKVAEHAAEPA